MSIKSLVAVLSSFILPGKDKAAGVQQRLSALHAASVYVLLLGIPGEETRKDSLSIIICIHPSIQHPCIFNTCLVLRSGHSGQLESIPAVIGRRQGNTLDKSLVHLRTMLKDKQLFALIDIP